MYLRLLVKVRKAYRRVKALVKSRCGHNTMVFMVFVAIASALWFVMALNEEATFDLQVPVRLTHVPDSVKIISDVPASLRVTVRGKGTQLLRYLAGNPADADIDFRMYRSAAGIRLGDVELKSIVRSSVGGSSVQLVSPDSVIILYTSAPPVLLPVELQCIASAAPGSTIVGSPTVSVDSVKVYSVKPLPTSVTSVKTEPLRYDNLQENVNAQVKLIAPAGTRVEPDSTDLRITVEPLILKEREIVVETVNQPAGSRMIIFPAKVTVMYMVPMSQYTKTEPNMRVVADYNEISTTGSGKVKLRLRNVPQVLQNVHLQLDSASYYISK